MSLYTLPKTIEEVQKVLLELDRRLVNVEGYRGGSISHKDLRDTADHNTYIKRDGSRVMGSNLNMGGNKIINSGHAILNAELNKGTIVVDQGSGGLTINTDANTGGITADDIPEGTTNQYFTPTRSSAVSAATASVQLVALSASSSAMSAQSMATSAALIAVSAQSSAASADSKAESAVTKASSVNSLQDSSLSMLYSSAKSHGWTGY